jgi:exonuclease III
MKNNTVQPRIEPQSDKVNLKLMSINIEGGTWYKLPTVLDVAEKNNINIIAMQETNTRTSDWSFIPTPNWETFHSCDDTSNTRQAGSSVLVHKSISVYCHALPTPQNLKGRVSVVKIWNKRKPPILLVALYAPANKKNRQTFFPQIKELIAQYPTMIPLLIGDFNAYFMPIDSLRNSTRNSKELLDLMNTNSLVDTYRIHHPNEREYTWFRYNSKKQSWSATRIDHVITKAPILPIKVDIKKIISIVTDHNAIIAEIPWQRRRKLSPHLGKRELPYKRNLTNEQNKSFNEKLTALLNNIDLSNPLTDLNEILVETASKIAPADPRTPQKAIFKERGLKIKERKQIGKIMAKLMQKKPLNDKQQEYIQTLNDPQNPEPELRKKQKKLHNEIRRYHREQLNTFIKKKIRELRREGIAKTSKFYKAIRRKLNPRTSVLPLVVTETLPGGEEKAYTNYPSLMKATKDYWERIFAKAPTENPSYLPHYHTEVNKLPPNHAPILAEPISSEEMQQAISALSSQKATGEDQVAAELLKELNETNTEILTVAFNKLIETADIPFRWKHARIWSIYKGGDTTKLQNYRPISLCQTTYKLLTKIIQQRLATSAEEHRLFSETQTGFRKGNSPHDNVFTLNCIKEEAAFRGKKLHCLKLDLAKAFDSIPHKSIIRTLKHYGYNKRDIKLIKGLYKDSTASVITKYGITGVLPIKRGVKQGDPLSPILFNLVINPLLSYLQSTLKGYIMQNGTHISNLTFADDIFLISDTVDKLRNLFNATNDFLKAHSRKINYGKCEYITTEPKPQPLVIQHNNETITLKPKPPGETFKLLGAHIDLHNIFPYITIPDLIEKHKQRLQMIMSRPLPSDTKAHLINLYASLKLLYHTYTNQFSPEDIKKIDITNRAILREQLHLWMRYDTNILHGPEGYMDLVWTNWKKSNIGI